MTEQARHLSRRILWMSISGTVCIVCLFAACMTMSLDDAGHFHVNLVLIAAAILSSFLFLWTMSRS